MSGTARMATWLYGLCLPPDDQAALGDLLEEHAERRLRVGAASSDAWLWRQVILSVVPSLLTGPARYGWRRPLAAFLTGGVVFYGLGVLTLLAIDAFGSALLDRPSNGLLFAAYTFLSVGAAYAAGRSVSVVAKSAATLVTLALILVVLTPEIVGLVTGTSSEPVVYRLVWETLIPTTLLVSARREAKTTKLRPAL